jgi:eukaryotic-like serine/threonine-protein kinase
VPILTRPDSTSARSAMSESASLEPNIDTVLDDQSRRWQTGEREPVEAYLERHPELRERTGVALDLIYHEALLRQRDGQKPCSEEYERRFPHLADEIRRQFAIHDAFPSASSVLKSAKLEDAVRDPSTIVNAGRRARTSTLPKVPGYEIEEILGHGGCGLVYKAIQLEPHRVVAMKMISAHLMDNRPEFLARFRSEANAIAKLQHPNVVPIYAFGEHEGQPYFTMEYLEGGSLAQKLVGTPLPPREAAELAEIVARAMHHAHERGVIHRDLKPGNVLLAAEGTPKVSDFGFAKHLETEAAMTKTGDIMGTPSYMAPEQASGSINEISRATDVYGLGAILYETVTGRPPFKGATAWETLVQVRNQEPVPPSRLQPKLPPDLETICMKCLEKETSKRYATALALAEDLRRYLAGQPIRARRTGGWERGWRWCRRNPALSITSGLAATALAGVVVLLIFRAAREASAARSLRAEKAVTEAALHDARLQAASLLRYRGLALCERGSVGQGILWLARGLETTPANAGRLVLDVRTDLAAWGQELRPLLEALDAPDMAYAHAWSRDGRVVALGCKDGSIWLWDLTTGHWLAPPFHHGRAVRALAFSPNGKTLVTGGYDETARIWDIETGRPVGKSLRHDSVVTAVAFTPDGSKFLTTTAHGIAQLWELKTATPIGQPWQHRLPIWAAAISPDGKLALTGSDDQTAQLWEVETGKRHGRPLDHGNMVLAVAFSPNGRKLLTGGADGVARIWDAATGKCLIELVGHQGTVEAVAFSPDSQTVLSGSTDRTARLWDAATGKAVGPPLPNKSEVGTVVFRGDGKLLLTGSQDGARLWQAAAGANYRVLPHPSFVGRVAFSPDGRTLLTGSGDFLTRKGEARLWDAARGESIGEPLPHSGWVTAVAFSPSGTRFLTGSGHVFRGGGEARLWDTATRKPLGPVIPYERAVLSVAFSPDGTKFLTGCRDKSARLYDAATGKLVFSLPHEDGVCAVAFSPNGKTILTGGEDNTARLWDAPNGKPVGEPLRHQGTVVAVCFSPDGRRLLTAGMDHLARLWDTATGRPVGRPLRHDEMVFAAVFSPDGKTILTAGADNTARLWDAATCEPIGQPLTHGSWVFGAAFSPLGNVVATGSRDGTARLWELPAPLEGDVERIGLWTQVLTGMELHDDGVLHFLDGQDWRERRQRLLELGGHTANSRR